MESMLRENWFSYLAYFNCHDKKTPLRLGFIIYIFNKKFLISFQCCLISGESGSGKTVSADYLVRHLAELGKVCMLH